MTTLPALVDPQWLQRHLHSTPVQFIDARFFLPTEARDAAAEFQQGHVPKAVFFDIDAINDRSNPLPHMLPSPEAFSHYMQALGINSSDPIICYDDGRFMGACRAWWTFRIYGHTAVAVLDGGLPAWQAAGLPLATGSTPPPEPNIEFKTDFHPERLATLITVRQALQQNTAQVIDARSAERFTGHAPEPRPGLRTGHMPGAINFPFTELITPQGRLADSEQLKTLFTAAGVDLNRPVITSCGSGVSAAVLLLALELLGHRQLALYDGSWAEWGARHDTPIVSQG